MRRAAWRSVRSHLSYEVAELARVCGVSRSTIRNWIKSGLPAMTDRKPILIYGAELKQWRQETLHKRKQKCAPGEMFCFTCRKPKRPALGMAEYHPDNPTHGRIVALCETCERTMYRACALARISEALPGLDIKVFESGAETKCSD